MQSALIPEENVRISKRLGNECDEMILIRQLLFIQFQQSARLICVDCAWR